ncbi:MAG: hypothetical protein ABSA83_13615 [Verrucomicrobiota bacterium]|jgi:hypothetical protein
MQELFPLESSWVVAMAAGALALIMLLWLARSLPGQNIAIIAFGLLAGQALLDFFLANYAQIEIVGPMWCYLAGSALLWLAVVLSLRRVAQFIMHPWRGGTYYGIWVIGMASVFTAAFQFGWPCLLNLNPEVDPIPPERAAIMGLIRGAATALFLTGLVPWFIRKRPVSRKKRSELAQQPEQKTQ